ncbi:hypothetical protein Tco_0221994 [Tanacetum coccineum]
MEVKVKLTKIVAHEVVVHKTPLLRGSFPAAWRILKTFVIQVLGGNHSSIEQLNSSQQLIVYSLLIGTKIDIREIIYYDLVTRLMAKSRQKYASYPRFIFCVLQRLLEIEEKPKTVTKPKPKSQGLKASGAFPKKGKKAKTKQTTLIQTTLKLNQQKESSWGTDTSQSMSTDRPIDPQDTKRNIQLVVTGLPSTLNYDLLNIRRT